MIIGTSHFALATADISSAVRFFLSLGYAPKFEEDQLHNHPEKRVWLRAYQPTHHVVMMKKNGFQSIELLQHGDYREASRTTAAPVGRCIPVFQIGLGSQGFEIIGLDEAFPPNPTLVSLLPFSVKTLGRLEALFGGELHIVRAGPDGVLGLARIGSDSELGIVSTIIPVKDVPAYKRFLVKLRFRPGTDMSDLDGEPQRFRHVTPFPELNSEIIVVASDWSASDLAVKLDNSGINCIAVVRRGASETLNESEIPVVRMTEPFSLKVNNKNMDITLAEFSDGPVWEFLTL